MYCALKLIISIQNGSQLKALVVRFASNLIWQHLATSVVFGAW